MNPELANFLLGLLSLTLVALAGSHIMLMLKVHGHDFDIHRLFDRLRMKRKGEV